MSKLYDPNSGNVYFSQCFDRFQFLSRGSYGIASAARSKDDYSFYALKHSVSKTTRDTEKMFMNEIRCHEFVPKHPNLIQLHSAWKEKGFMFIQMELCLYGDLDQRFCKRTPKPEIKEELVWSYFIDVLLVSLFLKSQLFYLFLNILFRVLVVCIVTI